MSTKFYIYNEVTNATLIPSSVNASFPASNLKDDRRTKVFRSTSNSSDIVFDLGTSRPIDSFFIVDHTTSGFGVNSLTLELNGTNEWSSPVFSQAITLDFDFGIGKAEFTEGNYRFARLVMTSTAGYCELSNVFIGKRTEYLDFDISYPLTLVNNNLSIISKNRYGQRFIDEVTTQRKIKGNLENMNQAEADDVISWISYVSNTIPFFVSFDGIQSLTNSNRLNGMYYLNNEPGFTLNRGNYWSCSLDLEEST
jgi:hypothetical protein